MNFRLATILVISLALVYIFWPGGDDGGHVHGPGYTAWKEGPSSDPLSPEDSLRSFVVQPGYRVEIVASEPLVQDPVAIAFDASGRMWVAEMTGYMLDISGTGQHDPVGKIVIVSDEDGDGIYDRRQVFLDKLGLPRAIAHVPGGILFADNSSLWFVADNDGKAGKPELVDEDYAAGNNVEHKSNGLLTNLDNWIYSANSTDVYRTYPAGSIVPQGTDIIYENAFFSLAHRKTVKRGQWGITSNDFGQLFYNNNSVLLIADTLRSDVPGRNPNFQFPQGHQQKLADNRVWPVRPTPGVNRGYRENMLDEDRKLLRATAASGPVIYRGDAAPGLYDHAVVPEPAANLVAAFTPDGHHMHEGSALLASNDERFRPVNTYTGPDGALYVVDMYRGILQDQFFLTKYLADYITGKKLDEGVHMGRIYRIVADGSAAVPAPDLQQMSGGELVSELSRKNAWRRDTARRLLIERQDKAAIPGLLAMAGSEDVSDATRLGALWTLEGLGALENNLLVGALDHVETAEAVANLIHLAEALEAKGQRQIARRTGAWLDEREGQPEFDIVRASALASLSRSKMKSGDRWLSDAFERYNGSVPFAAEVLLSGLAGEEEAFISSLEPGAAQSALAAAFAVKPPPPEQLPEHLSADELTLWKRGRSRYFGSGACAGCHGENGEGVEFAGPPLASSEWVTGEPDRLLALLLNGMAGPMHVNGVRYEVDMDMPALEYNADLGASDIAGIATYIRNTWGNEAEPLTTGQVNAVRERFRERKRPWTEKELLEIF